MVDDKNIAAITDKIDDINKKAWQVRVNDSPKAFELSHESVRLSREINYPKGLAEGLRSLGFCYVRLSKNEEALNCLNEALALFETFSDLKGVSTIYEYLGIVQRNWGNLEASLDLLYKALALADQIDFSENQSTANYQVGVTLKHLGNYEKALDNLYKSLQIAQSTGFVLMEAYAINVIGSIYFDNGDYTRALEYYQQGLIIRQQSGDKWGEAGSLDNLGLSYFMNDEYDKAIQYCSEGLAITESTGDQKGQSNGLFHLGQIYKALKDYDKTVSFCKRSLAIRKHTGDKKGEAEILIFLAELSLLENYYERSGMNPYDFLNLALKTGEDMKSLDLLSKVHQSFYRISKFFNRHEEALEHLEKAMALEKDIHGVTTQQKILSLEIEHRVETSKKETEIYRLKNVELAGLYEESKKQKEEIEEQKKVVEASLAELKTTQQQLIQAEKMASLGELTAGIAHEIQNPLNFVNNFSEVNKELIEELKSQKSKLKSEELDDLLNDISDNEEKINHHGKRADAIVKGMLQHSRKSEGKTKSTNINTLCDEYLRLAYHGFRAKDKAFNAEIKTDFDETIGKINIVHQDIGRVLLNLFNNAFYAVNQRLRSFGKLKVNLAQPDSKYKPLVTVETKGPSSLVEKVWVEIIVTDNGNGIPQNIIDKIFQPFFTTKPTGQGTGLGLSLAYDIITKEHNGTIKVESKEGEGSTFIIQLPM